MAGKKLSKKELLEELDRVGTKIGGAPAANDMNKRGAYSVAPYYRAFGSWNRALAAAGYTPYQQDVERSREELLAELKRVADACNRKPTKSDMDEKGKFRADRYGDRFGSWNEALEAAGFEPRANGNRIPEDDLLLGLQNLHRELGHVPKTTDMNEKGSYSPGTYVNRFGSWGAALDAANIE